MSSARSAKSAKPEDAKSPEVGDQLRRLIEAQESPADAAAVADFARQTAMARELDKAAMALDAAIRGMLLRAKSLDDARAIMRKSRVWMKLDCYLRPNEDGPPTRYGYAFHSTGDRVLVTLGGDR